MIISLDKYAMSLDEYELNKAVYNYTQKHMKSAMCIFINTLGIESNNGNDLCEIVEKHNINNRIDSVLDILTPQKEEII